MSESKIRPIAFGAAAGGGRIQNTVFTCRDVSAGRARDDAPADERRLDLSISLGRPRRRT